MPVMAAILTGDLAGTILRRACHKSVRMALIDRDIQRIYPENHSAAMTSSIINSVIPGSLPRSLIYLAFLICLVSCGSQPARERPAKSSQASALTAAQTQNIQQLLLTADRSTTARADELKITAAELALTSEDAVQAQKILALVSQTPPTPLLQRFILAQARVALRLEQPQLALQWLADNRLVGIPMTSADQLAQGQLRAQAYLLARSYLASAREKIAFDPLLSEAARNANHDSIFDTLLSIPTRSLTTQAEAAITSDLRGWLSLAAMTQQYQSDPVLQLQALNNWRRVWSFHPAATRLPMSLQLLTEVVRDQPKIIALLLPLQGDLGLYGRAIRDGILASHYQRHGQAEIKLFDTSDADVKTLLIEAQAAGAELVIGPLSRENVTLLAREQLSIPVLALNRSIDATDNPALYQFGLAPEDEIYQIAEQAYKDGQRNALMIYPSGEWGNRNAAVFQKYWAGLGGNVIDSAEYTNQKDYSDLIKTLLAVDKSESRSADLRRIIGERFEFTPRRRQDIDFVFLLANSAQARGINPTLAFYYAEDIPVYATSNIHDSSHSKIEAIDLNGIRFSEIPWKLMEIDVFQRQIQTTWPAAGAQLSAFYALGVDAYQLYPRLKQLKALRNSKIHGVTGVLRLNEDNVLTRELMWGRFENGRVTIMPAITDAS